jgi:transposase
MTSPYAAEDASERSSWTSNAIFPSTFFLTAPPLPWPPSSKLHPSAQTIGRDGSREYARGIAEGAPEEVEILDRWHLLKNLREALERMLDRNQQSLGGINVPSPSRPDKATTSLETSDYAPPPRSPREEARSRTKREKRYAPGA